MNQYLVKVGCRLALLAAIGFSGVATQAQIAIPPSAKVTPDTSKPGFNWTIFANQANRINDDIRPENALARSAPVKPGVATIVAGRRLSE
jgi:hypothetical protein